MALPSGIQARRYYDLQGALGDYYWLGKIGWSVVRPERQAPDHPKSQAGLLLFISVSSLNRDRLVPLLRRFPADQLAPPGGKEHGTTVAKTGRMEKLRTVTCLVLAFITLVLASCANQSSAPAASNTGSPMDRNKGNGLASFMH